MSNQPFSRRDFIKTTAMALPLLAAGCAGTSAAATGRRKSSNDFVTIRHGRFELGHRPYFYVGTNFWCCCYLSDAGLPGGRERMVRELDNLQSIGVKNIRLLAGSETSPLAGSIPRGITRAPHDYDEALLEGLDFALAEMAKRDMRGILFLSNYWQWSGGFAQYVRWVTGENIPDPDRPEIARGDWSGFMKFSARLYTTAPANELYLGYVTKIIQRRNTVNGNWPTSRGRVSVTRTTPSLSSPNGWMKPRGSSMTRTRTIWSAPVPKAFMAAWTRPTTL
jgi:mannan endo-1,4-beta-mannosidase